MPGATVTPATAGFHGKVPSHGDFVTRRLPRSFIDPWDGWLQDGITRSREQLVPGWLDIYLTSPLWRFVLSPGICGEQGWAGLLMPSVDRVGRYFPLTLAAPLPANGNPLQLIDNGGHWFARAESLLLSALDDGFDLAAFDREVEALGLPAGAGAEAPPNPPAQSARHPAWHIPLPQPEAIRGGTPDLARQLLQSFFFAYSLWWTSGSDRVDSSLLICQGLPPVEGFSALLGGDWSRWGWQTRNLAADTATAP